MTTTGNRPYSTDVGHPEKEEARDRANGASHEQNDRGHSTAETERPMYWPLAWDRDAKPASFRGKAKRNARRAAADRKRQSGQIDPALIAIAVLAVLECLLIWGAS